MTAPVPDLGQELWARVYYKVRQPCCDRLRDQTPDHGQIGVQVQVRVWDRVRLQIEEMVHEQSFESINRG